MSLPCKRLGSGALPFISTVLFAAQATIAPFAAPVTYQRRVLFVLRDFEADAVVY